MRQGSGKIVGAALLGLLLALLLLAPALVRLGAARRLGLGLNATTGETRVLGRVHAGAFRPLAPREAIAPRATLAPGARFTALPMQAAQAPESAELDLSRYEGQAVVIQGRISGGWVYGARVASTFGPWPAFLIRWAWLGR